MKTNFTPSNRSFSGAFSGTFGGPPPQWSERQQALAVARKVQHILVPIDFSYANLEALQQAFSLAEGLGAQVTLVHVMEDLAYRGEWMSPPTEGDFAPSSRHLVEELRRLTEGKDRVMEPVVRVGRPADEIIAVAEELGCQMIVISSQGYTGQREVLLGSVAERVLHHAPCPVLVVKTQEAPGASGRGSRGA